MESTVNTNTNSDDDNCSAILERLNLFLPERDISKYNYSPLKGIYPSKINMYTEVIHNRAKVFFAILDKYNLEYVVFAGSSIGYKRMGKNMPWVDDYDIMIFEENISKFENEICPILTLNGFICIPATLYPDSGYHVINCPRKERQNDVKYFLCDIFYSCYTDNGKIKNRQFWGKYHRKGLTADIVFPIKRLLFHGDLNLPFMNDMDKEIELCYGDIFKQCIISTHSLRGEVVYDKWEDAVSDFNHILNRAIKNTLDRINVNKEFRPQNKISIYKYVNQFSTEIEILIYINQNNVGTIEIFDPIFLTAFSASIKFYFPNVHLIFTIYEKESKYKQFFDYIDTLKVSNEDIKNFYDHKDLIFINKPKILIIEHIY